MRAASCSLWRGFTFAFLIAWTLPAPGAITIGGGPWIGTDSAGNSFNQEFQDWAYGDLRALDESGTGWDARYNWFDGFDDARDLVAFYHRVESGTLYLRADLYDLKRGAENGNLDIYVMIDCDGTAAGNGIWLPDFTDCQTDMAWDLAVAVYDSVNYTVYDKSWSTAPRVHFRGAYFHAELDSVEFGLGTQALMDAGWNGARPLHFQVFTCKDGTNGQGGEIGGMGFGPGNSDLADAIVDDDRGFGDGTLNGWITSTDAAGRAKFASIAHGNQSLNRNSDTRIHIFDPNTNYRTGFVRALDTHEIFDVPLNIHMSGTLISACLWAAAAGGGADLSDGPSFLARVADFVDDDQNDHRPGALIGGVYSEHIMPYFEGEVNRMSIARFNELIRDVFGLDAARDVKVMHTPERVIRSQPTGLLPLTGLTFADIAASSYAATYLDEVTHLHWWFYPNEPWSGMGGSYERPYHHKIHRINGVYCFMINDREDQLKFWPQDGGMHLDARFTALWHAMHVDQAQLILVFDDWEAMAGKSFDPGEGRPTENNNQIQYQQVIRWAANHPWIEVVTLKEILERATSPAHPQYDANWVVDQGMRNDLSIQTYEWLKHAAEGSYHYWYYNENAGFSGNEQDFEQLVPVLLGPQGDYRARGLSISSDAQANAADGPKLPSGKRNGDLNQQGTLLRDAWDAVASAPQGRMKELAEWTYAAMIYETAWHEEDNGDYYCHDYTACVGVPGRTDTTWDGVNTWALRLSNHVRDVGKLAEAARWAAEVRSGVQTANTRVRQLDLDQDGRDEFVLQNNRLYACFERWGGRCVLACVFDRNLNDAVCVIGAPVVNPSEPGEEERSGSRANRCSAFKEMNAEAYTDGEYSVTAGADAFTFVSGDGKVRKTIRLAAATARLEATYTNTTGGPLYVRIGASPNNLDLLKHGLAHLQVAQTAQYYEVRNTQGGMVRVVFGSATLNPTPADAGFNNRELALTQQIEVYGGGSFAFEVVLGEDAPGGGATQWALY